MKTMNVIGSRSGCAWLSVLRTAEACRKNGKRIVVYVPEQLTLQTERDLILGLKLPGLLDIDVVSPSKLRRQVREATGSSGRKALDALGRVMAVQRAMTELAKELQYYRDMAELPGAVSRLDQALEEMRDSGITLEEAAAYGERAATGAERAKFHDLALIWSRYQELTAERFEDDHTAWTETIAHLAKSGIWQGISLIVYGFDTVRPDLRELLAEASAYTDSITVTLTMDEESSGNESVFREQRESVLRMRRELAERDISCRVSYEHPERTGCAAEIRWLDQMLFAEERIPYPGKQTEAVSLYAAESLWHEAENLTETLIRWHTEGIAWDRMAVALPTGTELEGMLLARLRVKGIPFYSNHKEAAAEHGVSRLLLGALHCIRDGMDTTGLLTAAGSGFSNITEEECARLANYAAAHGIDRKRWENPFVQGDDAEETEEIRRRLLLPIRTLKEELKEARDAAASLEAVVHFLETEKVWEKLKSREEELLNRGLYREAVVDRQVWSLMMGLLDQLRGLLGERRASLKELADLLETAVSQAEISGVPEAESGVLIGEAGHMLSGELEGLILPCATDGLTAASASGWLTDAERDRFESTVGRPVGLSRERESRMKRFDLYRMLSAPRKKLRISRSLKGEDGAVYQPDALISNIREIFPEIREEGGFQGVKTESEPLTPQAAADGLAEKLSALAEGEDGGIPPSWLRKFAALRTDDRYRKLAEQMARRMTGEATGAARGIRPDTAQRLFQADRISISRLERYAGCPYRHFMDYGLRPVRKETFSFESDDAGNFFHTVLDRYMRTAPKEPGWPDLSGERVDELVTGICAEETREWEYGPLREDALGIWQGEDYLRRVRHAARTLTRFAANSDFRTIATEQAFGESEAWPPLVLTLRDGSRTAIRGKIDRIDTYENGEGLWLRIIDHKSREKRPDAARMHSGEQLQLMIYLKAGMRAFPGAKPAGALYFPVQDQEVEPDRNDPEAAEQARMDKARMKGLIAAEEDVTRAMDRDIRPLSVDTVFNKDGSVKKNAEWALEPRELDALMDAAAEKAAELTENMRSGAIAAAPSTDQELSVCRYCEYLPVCHTRKEDERPLDREITFRDLARKTRCKNG